MDRIPKPGECYRHFKNKLYQVITVATHTETGEKMVVYQALYGSFGTYVRPLSMFTSQVDKDKYPEAAQSYRFERVDFEQETGGSHDHKCQSDQLSAPPCQEEAGKGSVENQSLFAFLNAESYEAKLEILKERGEHFTDLELEAALESLELKEATGTREGRLKAVEDYLDMQLKYDGRRLR